MEGWESVQFEDCIESIVYSTKVQRKDFLSEGAYPIVSQEESLINGFWDEAGDVFEVDRPVVVFGDHTRILKYIDFDFVLGADGVKVLKPRPFLDPRFFFYQLHTAELNSLGYARHYRLLKEHRVSFPAFADQRRIASILDEAFEGIATAKAHAEKNLRNAREVFAQSREATLERSDGWLEASLSELCEIRHGYAFAGEHFATHGEHVLLTPGSFFETGGFRDRGGKTKYFVGAIPLAFVLDEGDLLVAMTEQAAGLLGSPLLVPEDGRYLHNQRLGRVIGRDSAPWTNEFFFHVFNLRRVRAEIHASASGVKVRHTSPAKIGAVRVKFPPTSGEQSALAAALRDLAEDCHRLQASYTRKLAALDELKKSLLHQAFSGAL
jgi:type I restriction enzyme S subunit